MPEPINTGFATQKNLQENKPIMLYDVLLNDGVTHLRLCEWDTTITYNGINYLPFPLTHEGISQNALGEIDAIKVHMSAVDRSIVSLLEANDGLRGNQVIMTLVFADLLSDPNANISQTFYIDSVETTELEAVFVLTTKLDLWQVKLPGRMMYRNCCAWVYMGAGCWIDNGDGTYSPSPDFQNQPIQCDKTLTGQAGCQLHGNKLRYGGFPGIPEVEVYTV
jgi:lambda family phage minor tail protein L